MQAIHISGGSWCDIKCVTLKPRPFGGVTLVLFLFGDPRSELNRTIGVHRDTHDGDVPPEIITQLLPLALSLCPNLKVVILERFRDGPSLLSVPASVSTYPSTC